MTTFRIPRAPQAVVLALLWPTITVAEEARPTAADQDSSPVDCALIQDGVQRLACYDSLNNPKTAREQASEDEVEEAEQASDTLAPSHGSRKI